MHCRKNILLLAVSGVVAAGLPCLAQSNPIPAAPAPAEAATASAVLMEYQAALKLVKNWAPAPVQLGHGLMPRYSEPSGNLRAANESGATSDDGYRCLYKDTPHPVIRVKPRLFGESEAHVTLNCNNGKSSSLLMSQADAKRLAAAWTTLAAGPPADSPEQAAAFEAIVEKYRADPESHVLPEEARAFKVQAEMAVSEKRFADAAVRFAKALEISPWWAPGHYNLALIYGELELPGMAIAEMKKYLKLEPQAPNARAAQDQIYKWSDKLQR